MVRLGSVLLLALLGVSLRAASVPSAAIVREEFIHEPGAYPQCHASTVAETTAGTLVAAWFGGTHEKAPDVCIWVRRCVDGRWLPEQRVADGVQSPELRYPTWNPVLFQPRHGPLLLFYKIGPSPETWWGMLTTSDDDGRTWSAPRRLPDGMLGPIKDKPVELADGTLVCGSSVERDGGKVWQVHLERTPDLGRTWERIGPLATEGAFNAIQPAIFAHADGRLQILCRTKEMTLVTSWSADAGRTWSPLAPSGLYAPNSGIDAVTLADGRQLVVYNHRDRPQSGPPVPKQTALGAAADEAGIPRPNEDWGARWPLNVALSSDGEHWTMALVLEDQPLLAGYAYPAVIQTRDGLVHVTYTWDRIRIKHVVLDPRRL